MLMIQSQLCTITVNDVHDDRCVYALCSCVLYRFPQEEYTKEIVLFPSVKSPSPTTAHCREREIERIKEMVGLKRDRIKDFRENDDLTRSSCIGRNRVCQDQHCKIYVVKNT
ncbi:uncharacterized protein LOC105275510 [Ooceraea biroi]|uniref:uncharacterized protein LOC105275510 n=1 Tax=Ooceraea biroi TaxID=2015173 RepID=UPI000F08E843|nr:uncharacterized protein LOC105275510 [Ooceraea biroi]